MRTESAEAICGPEAAALLETLVERGKDARVPARGSSMRPLIEDGDLLTVRPLLGRRPRVGDVIVANVSRGSVWRDAGQSLEPAEDAESVDAAAADASAATNEAGPAAATIGVDVAARCGGCVIVRRVVCRRGLQYLLRADDRLEADGWFPRLSIAGVVAEVERGGRRREIGSGRLGRRAPWLVPAGRYGPADRVLEAPRAAARALLHGLQRSGSYRRLARRHGVAVEISEAAVGETLEAGTRFGLAVDYDAAGRPVGPAPSGPPMSGDESATFVARHGRRVVGVVQHVVRPGDALWSGDWLYALVVWTPYRGMGIGRRLTEAVVARARRRGAERLLLTAPRGNRAAIALYAGLGFRPIEEGPLADHLRESDSPYERELLAMRLLLHERGPAGDRERAGS